MQKIEELAALGTRARPAAASGRGRAGRLRRGRGRPQDVAEDPRAEGRGAHGRRRSTDDAPPQAACSQSAAQLQRARFNLPAFPTTTIGSFPQTAEVRKARAAHAKGALSDADYETFLQEETARAVRWQEEIGLDVLVHGEFERNDMVQYFGEQLSGFAFTENGWVQSYGSRCVRPPILFGDVSRPKPMTVEWWQYAQSLTKKPMKGMLTGPVTILQLVVRARRRAAQRGLPADRAGDPRRGQRTSRSRRRGDDPDRRGGAARRAAAAEVRMEGLSRLGGRSFRLCASGVRDETQIHTHMCYSEFNDIIDAIAAMDADVISIETSRSKMELLDAFKDLPLSERDRPRRLRHPFAARARGRRDDRALLKLARQRLSDAQLWINPDCGLKTRKWEEVRPALVNMVAAARELRALA